MTLRARRDARHDKILGALDAASASGLGIDTSRLLRQLQASGLPTRRRHEGWKYSNPSVFIENICHHDSEPCMRLTADRATPVDLPDAEASRLFQSHVLDDLDLTRLPMASLALACLNACTVVVVHREANATIHLRRRGEGSAPTAGLVVLEAGAEADLIEHEAVACGFLACVLRRGSRLRQFRLHPVSQGDEYNMLTVDVGEEAQYELRQHSRGGANRRNDIWIRLQGRGAECRAIGGWRLGADEHVDFQVIMDHAAPDTTSKQRFHGAVSNGGCSVFGGRIWIAPHAQRTDAGLVNRNLIDGLASQAYTKPELEIYADDVKCSHGATVGQLDTEAMFYLRSRGVARQRAAALLVDAFLKAVTRDKRERAILCV